MAKPTRIKATLPPKLAIALKREAKVTELPIAEVIRRAISEYITRRVAQ